MTGGDPPNIKLRAVQSLAAVDYFIQVVHIQHTRAQQQVLTQCGA